MNDPSDSRPYVLVRCDRLPTRDLVTTILRQLDVAFECFDQSERISSLPQTTRADLLLADSVGAVGPIHAILDELDARSDDLIPTVILLADSESSNSLIEWTSRRFQAVLLIHPVSRERLTTAIEAGLRLNSRATRSHHESHASATDEVQRKTRYWAAVSHEIRTPVNALILGCQLLRAISRDSLPYAVSSPEIEELTEELVSQAGSLVDLVDDLLDIARLDQGQVELIASNFALGDWITQTLAEFHKQAQRKGLSLAVQVATPDAVLRTDRGKLARVVQILVGNAIKFTETGSIHVSTQATAAEGFRIEVEDTGVGIPRADWQGIFDAFAQLRNPERDRTKGTGLGLALCRQLVNAMGGIIWVNPDPRPLGTALVVEIPAEFALPSQEEISRWNRSQPSQIDLSLSQRMEK